MSSLVQGDHGGQRLHFVDFILEVPRSQITAMELWTTKQNWADSGATKLKATQPSLRPVTTMFTMYIIVATEPPLRAMIAALMEKDSGQVMGSHPLRPR